MKERNEVGVASSGITFLLSVVKIGYLVQKLKVGAHSTQYDDLIGLLLSLKKESRQKMHYVLSVHLV
jgi:hypothetical protein